jgi:hypothetical protein
MNNLGILRYTCSCKYRIKYDEFSQGFYIEPTAFRLCPAHEKILIDQYQTQTKNHIKLLNILDDAQKIIGGKRND